MKKDLTALWHQFPEAIRFIEASKAKGYVLAAGTQRPYIVVDETGRSFDLVRQLEGVKTREVRERFKETKLPTEKKAIALAREAQKQRLAKASEVSKKVEPSKVIEKKAQEKAAKPAVIDKVANDNLKKVEAEKPQPKPVISWTMSGSFVQKSADQEHAQEKLKEILTKEEEDKKKREKLIEEMKRRRELAAKFRDNEQEMF